MFLQQYLLGRYFSAPTGEEQLVWLLGGENPEAAAPRGVRWDPTGLRRISFDSFCDAVGLFQEEEDTG